MRHLGLEVSGEGENGSPSVDTLCQHQPMSGGLNAQPELQRELQCQVEMRKQCES